MLKDRADLALRVGKLLAIAVESTRPKNSIRDVGIKPDFEQLGN
ncbi:MAG: hypothetical protein ABI883_03625 [Chthoniobacterales bacterium]